MDDGVDPRWAPPAGPPNPGSGPAGPGASPQLRRSDESQRRPRWKRPAPIIAIAIGITAIGVFTSLNFRHDQHRAPTGGLEAGREHTDPATTADWIKAVCGPLAEDRISRTPELLRNASTEHYCNVLGPGSADDNIGFFFGEYPNTDQMSADIDTFPRFMFPVFAYATRPSSEGTVWLALSQGYVENPPASARDAGAARIASLERYGFHSEMPGTAQTGTPVPAPTSRSKPTTAATSHKGACGPDEFAALQEGLSQVSLEPQTGLGWSSTPVGGNYDPCAELSTILLTVDGATGSSPVQALMFHRGEFLGTGTSRAYAFTSLDKSASTNDMVVLQYRTGQSCTACDDGQTTTVRYRWTGTRVEMLDPPPPG